MKTDFITLAHGSGGQEMTELIRRFSFFKGKWKNCDNDSATLSIGGGKHLAFTTDSFTVDPIFFPGGDIGHLSFSGTVNDLAVMGATPLGLSLGFVMEEGFPMGDLGRITNSIARLSKSTCIPVVTGDTKVMGKGKMDKIVINTSGVGLVLEKELLKKKIAPGDRVILSGGLGEHAVALLSKRFNYETSITTDSKPLIEEMKAIRSLIKVAKDPTRGGLASILNEMCERGKVGMVLDEDSIPAKPEVVKVAEMLGLNLYELACEGRLACVCSPENSNEVEKKLKRFNKDASIIGGVVKGKGVIIQTILGKRVLPVPTGRIVPRIC
ncbi:MAG: hydrogenase expression/formation protein HypE [Candidatus Micrarchaeota archaeon]